MLTFILRDAHLIVIVGLTATGLLRSLKTGKIPLTRRRAVSQQSQPTSFWAIVIACCVSMGFLSIVIVEYALHH